MEAAPIKDDVLHSQARPVEIHESIAAASMNDCLSVGCADVAAPRLQSEM